ncbi:MAG TPA: hypothetical protein VF482_06150 [Trebonia sp.]
MRRVTCGAVSRSAAMSASAASRRASSAAAWVTRMSAASHPLDG